MSIQAGPHYEIPSSELALWLEQQGDDRWWNVDGDPLLTGRLPFPCPADELALELRKINRPLLVQAKQGDARAKGQVINAAELGELIAGLGENMQGSPTLPDWTRDRFLYLCWKGKHSEWLLAEDSATTQQMHDEVAKAK